MKKILWVTSTPFRYHRILLGQTNESLHTGSWFSAALENIAHRSDIQLHIATYGSVENCVSGVEDGISYHILPCRGGRYNARSKSAAMHWKFLREDINPDIIHIWGTESQFSLAASRTFRDKPIVLFVQGLIGVIQRHYYDGLPNLYKYLTLRDFYNRISYKKQTLSEKEIIKNSTCAIVENSWGESQILAINPHIEVIRVQVPIRRQFYTNKWDVNNCNKYELFTNAGGYPVKGHHIIFKALSIVKRLYPNIKLVIPGPKIGHYTGIIRKTGYIIYLKTLIRKYQLEDNIEYKGTLSGDEMVNRLCSCNAFIMPSVAENHSNSLIEALMLGVPCISSCVGETVNHIRNGENGFLYNSTDYTSLAGLIIKCLRDQTLIKNIGEEASQTKLIRNESFGESMVKIYMSL